MVDLMRDVFIQYTYRLLVSVAFFCSIDFFFAGCDNRQKQNKDSISLESNTATRDSILFNQGMILFKDSCGRCHSVWKLDNSLEGIVVRLGEDYFNQYVTKQDSLIKAKDDYALKLKEAYGNRPNAHNFTFSTEQLNAIIYYLKKYTP